MPTDMTLLPSMIEKAFRSALMKVGLKYRNLIKEEVPVLTGNLRSSVVPPSFDFAKSISYQPITATYAQDVAFGSDVAKSVVVRYNRKGESGKKRKFTLNLNGNRANPYHERAFDRLVADGYPARALASAFREVAKGERA